MNAVSLHGALANERPWTASELERLRALFPSKGAAATAAELGRTVAAVFHKANRLGVRNRRRWTPADDARLQRLWETDKPLATIARDLERTLLTTYWRAQLLGLPLGVPAGYEYLTAAVERTGYSATGQLRRILDWAGVRVYAVRTRRNTPRSRTMHYVEPFDVDEAIERWHKTEPLEVAARRHGVCADTLRRWLLAIGVEEPKRAPKAHWRVLSEDADRAMAARERRR